MTQEEKAKAYDEALEKAKKTLESSSANEIAKTIIYHFFPELRESEDERVRKEIVSIVKAYRENCIDEGTHRFDDCLAYLEKQKEQKPWKVGANAYFTPEQKSEEVDESTKRLNDNWMKQHFDDYKEQKPAWSEEDEEMLEEIINHIDTTSIQRIPARPGSAIGKSWIKFLKSLRPQPKQEWSEEDEKIITRLIDYFESFRIAGVATKWEGLDIQEVITLLKSLRPSWRPSEDEERLINTSISFLKDFADKGYENAVECIDWLKSKLNGNPGK